LVSRNEDDMTARTTDLDHGGKGHTALVAPGVGASADADGVTMVSRSTAARAEGGGDLPNE
jgi:hypothetical protein